MNYMLSNVINALPVMFYLILKRALLNSSILPMKLSFFRGLV